MNKYNFLIIFLITSLIVSAQEKQITISQLWDGTFSAERLQSIRPLADGDQYTVLKIDRKTKSAAIMLYDYAAEGSGTALINSKDSPDIPFFTGYTFSKDETKILLETEVEPIYRRSKRAKYWVYDRNTKKASLLIDQKIQEPLLSPDGLKVAFVSDRNLYIKNLSDGTLSEITKDGNYETINGITDWVYEEEFGFVRAFDWNPNSNQLVYMRFDESEVPIFSMDIYGQNLYQFPYMFRYPKAGESNAVVTLHSYDLKTKNKETLQFPEEAPHYIPRIKFDGGNNSLIVQTINRHQNHLKVWRFDTAQNKGSVILDEKDAAYVSIHDNMTFLPDDSFLWTSERDGFNHIYHYDTNGNLIRQVTKGDWEVTAYYKYNPKTKEIYYQSVEKSTIGRAVYAIKLNGKGKRALSSEEGYNGARFSGDNSYYIHTFSDEKTAPVYTLRKTKDASKERTLIANQLLEENLKEYSLSNKEFSTLSINGEQLNMWMIKPKDFDPTKKYPLLMFQYSGPGSQQVTNRWGDSRSLWHKMLANKGYIIACVDGRGTGFKGAAFKKVTYMNLVKYEAIDQIDAAKALGALPYIDASRIGIWGWSFGGHMASHCLLTGNDVFSMAIAVAPVTNWRFYDTIYTERFMRTPQENPKGYDLNSPINYADQLKGKFLIIHGSGDDNVHVQNTMRMVEALIQEDKQFEWMIYPDKNHGIYGGNTRNHLYTKMTNFIYDNL